MATTMRELIDDAVDELKDREWDEDEISEIADSFVPVYTSDLLDLAAQDYGLFCGEIEADGLKSPEQMLRYAVYLEIEQGLYAALGEYRANVVDDDE